MFGGLALLLVLALLVVVIGVMVTTGVQSYWGHWLLVASSIVTVAALGYVWVSGAIFNANEASSAISPAARFGEIGLVLTLLGFAGVVVSSVMSALQARRNAPRAG